MRFDKDVFFVLMLMACIVEFLLMMNLASGFDNIGTYRSNTNLNLNLGCSYNNTYCASSFTCNISITNEDGVIINNQNMSNTYYPQYNYTISGQNLSKTGLYYGRQVCCGSIGCKDYSFEFTINAQGKQYGNIEGNIYIILLLIMIGAFIASTYGFLKIPLKNIRTKDGEIYKINWSKYLKFFLLGIAYLSMMSIAYFGWNLSYGVLEFKEMADVFNVLFRIMYILIIPIGFLNVSGALIGFLCA